MLAIRVSCCSNLSQPDPRGFETFRVMHAPLPRVPIVILSELSDEDTLCAPSELARRTTS